MNSEYGMFLTEPTFVGTTGEIFQLNNKGVAPVKEGSLLIELYSNNRDIDRKRIYDGDVLVTEDGYLALCKALGTNFYLFKHRNGKFNKVVRFNTRSSRVICTIHDALPTTEEIHVVWEDLKKYMNS